MLRRPKHSTIDVVAPKEEEEEEEEEDVNSGDYFSDITVLVSRFFNLWKT